MGGDERGGVTRGGSTVRLVLGPTPSFCADRPSGVQLDSGAGVGVQISQGVGRRVERGQGSRTLGPLGLGRPPAFRSQGAFLGGVGRAGSGAV